MPKFSYKGLKGTTQIAGEIEAPDADSLKRRLQAQGIQVEEIKKKGALDINLTLPTIGTGVSLKEVTIFTRQFATMIDAGLPLVQCLDIQVKQLENPAFKKIIKKVKETVESGSTFANALGKHPKLFDRLFVHMVEAGETGGVLEVIMDRLAVYMEKADKLKRKIKGAMIYPVIVFSLAIIIVYGLVTFVVPVFAKMFEGMGSKLPAITQSLLDLSNFSKKYGIFIIAGLAGAAFSFVTGRQKSTKFKYMTDNLTMHLPIFGQLIRKNAVAKFTRTLGTLISSGVPIIDALDITAKTSGNLVIETAVYETRKSISEGKTISEPLKKTKVFPSMVIQMIDVGEQSGALDQMLEKIAEFYEAEVDDQVDNLTAMMEPIIIVFLGTSIGYIVIAMFMPILTMASNL
ncbi:type II secretion system F family protein [Candidatus Dependentiae bacterium]|nr:type II secretion system F family protein [Candidatus Dependentiae bacterium]